MKMALLFVLMTFSVAEAWEVDFSRRQVEFKSVNNQDRLPASVVKEEKPLGLINKVFEDASSVQDIVIMNTEKGFVPDTVGLRKGNQYRIHVVNVNSQEKNISFIADAFSEHHNTFFGKVKTFTINPKTDGMFSFQCPETSVQGKFVVYPEERLPASSK